MASAVEGFDTATNRSSCAPPARRSAESAAIDWFASVAPMRSTSTGAPTPTSGSSSPAASVTTTMVESLSRAASAEERANASVRSPGSWVAVMPSIASSAASVSSVSLTSTSAVSAAATTVIRPPWGSRPTTSCARSRARAMRSSSSVLVAIEALVSTISTTLAARSDSTALNGRAAARTTIAAIRSWISSSQLKRSRCQGAFASTSRMSCCHRNVEPTGMSRRRRRSM